MDSDHNTEQTGRRRKKDKRSSTRERNSYTSQQSEKISQIYECKYCGDPYIDFKYMVIHHAMEHKVDHPVLSYYVIHLGHGLRDQERELRTIQSSEKSTRKEQNDETDISATANQSLAILKESFINYPDTDIYHRKQVKYEAK